MLEILSAIINNPSALAVITALLLAPVMVLFFVFKELFNRYNDLEDKVDQLINAQNLLGERVKTFLDIIASKIK